MHKTTKEAVEFVHEFRKIVLSSNAIEILIVPPFLSLFAISQIRTTDDRFALGAQNLHWEPEGAFTGEVSGPMLKDLGCDYVIVGHSERRHLFKESNKDVNRKVKAALNHDLLPILCIGETLEEREAYKTEAIVKDQMIKSLAGLDLDSISKITIAYEPVWAIGTERAATVEQAEEVHAFLRKTLASEWGEVAEDIRILYGGSVSPQNAETLFSCKEIDGALVGKACLDTASFVRICSLAAQATQ